VAEEQPQRTVITKMYTTGWGKSWSNLVPKTPEDVPQGWITLLVFPDSIMSLVNKGMITDLANQDAEFLYQWEFKDDGCYDYETGYPLFRIVSFTELVAIFQRREYMNHRVFIHPGVLPTVQAMAELCGSLTDTLRHFYTVAEPTTAMDSMDVVYERDAESL